MASGGWTSNSECGPELPQDFGGDSDHGAAKLAAKAQSHPNYTHGTFLGEEDYGVDRKNVSQPTPDGKPGGSSGKI